MNELPTGPAELLFELGPIRVFHYPTEADIKNNLMPKEVWYMEAMSKRVYGPFLTIYHSMQHYTQMAIATRQESAMASRPDAKIIHIDFVAKRKLKFHLPEGFIQESTTTTNPVTPPEN